MQSNVPEMLIQHKMSKKQVPPEDDKNCQSKKYYEPNKDQVKFMFWQEMSRKYQYAVSDQENWCAVTQTCSTIWVQ